MIDYPKPPYIKPKGSCMNPIVVHGIPNYANSVNNPKCVGIPEYLKWWEQQVYFILNGYDIGGGIVIPGRYYYYLNYTSFDTIMGTIYPQPCDLHLEIAYFIDWCKENHKNGILPKKRRGGISEAFKIMTIDYGYRFIPGYKGGIAGGHQKYVSDFMDKWTRHDESIVPEFKLKKLINKLGEIKAGWEVKEVDGVREYGTGNAIYARTMGENPGLFKGLYLNDVIGEEMGEFKHSKEFHEATKHCLMFGSIQRGNAWYYGTGDKMEEGMENFQLFWNKPELFNCKPFFIDATRFHYPYYGGAKDEFGNITEICPNLMHLTPEERMGVEDIVAAKESLQKVRDELIKTGDTGALIKECQNNPLDVNEVFRKTTSNHFDATVLSNIAMDIGGKEAQFIKYKFDYKRANNGDIITPIEIVKTPAKDKDAESECILISDDGKYVPTSQKLYCAGLDSYDMDTSKTSDSLGAMVVMIRDNDFAGKPKMKVVAMIRCRPKMKEIFYDMCLMLSIEYNLIGSVLIDVRNGVIIKHFEENGGRKYLARRPKRFESDNSEQVHEFGVSLNKFSKPRMVSLMQSYIIKHGNKIVFLELIKELKNYDAAASDSDNDAADALGIALMQNISMEAKPLNDEALRDREKRFEINNFEEDNKPWGEENITRDWDRFGQH